MTYDMTAAPNVMKSEAMIHATTDMSPDVPLYDGTGSNSDPHVLLYDMSGAKQERWWYRSMAMTVA